MTEGSLGTLEGVSIAVGGMIGGGIFAVLGVVIHMAGGATWVTFLLAGAVALCTAYSYTVLNSLSDGQGGAVTYVQCFLGNTTLAGMTGWTLLLGYVGTMAMYAYAFGSFAVGFVFVPDSVAGLPARPLVSVAAVAGFVGLNLLGARATGTVENLLVGAKVAVLLVLGVGGVLYGVETDALVLGLGDLVSTGPLVAAGVSFVAFEGWQLLYYDQESFVDPLDTVPRAASVAILVATGLYAVVAVATVSLAPPEAIATDPERALAVAADPFIPHGYVLVSLAALVSTGSAINATLFSAGHFTKGMLTDDLVPDQIGGADVSGVPTRTVLLLGGLTAALSVFGRLDAITSFASLTFIVVFGAINFLAVRQRHRDGVRASAPFLGLVGTSAFLPALLWHHYTADLPTFYAVVALTVGVVLVETLYFERRAIAEGVVRVEEVVERGVPERGE